MKPPLTRSDSIVLDYMLAYRIKHDRYPTLESIGQVTHYSTTAVHYHVTRLRAFGYLEDYETPKQRRARIIEWIHAYHLRHGRLPAWRTVQEMGGYRHFKSAIRIIKEYERTVSR